jgi:hypothetical protein
MQHVQFSLTRVGIGLVIAVVVSLPCAMLIFFNGGDVRPVVEFAVCLGIGAALSMVVPELLRAWRRQTSLRRPLRTYWTTAKSVLFTPRRFQFSVQSGLIYLTVVCCWLGFCVDRLHQTRAAAAEIVKSGGRVSYQSREPFLRVRAVSIARQGGPWDDDAIRRLFPHIHVLNPRRIVVGTLASKTIVADIEAEFPAVEVFFHGRGGD